MTYYIIGVICIVVGVSLIGWEAMPKWKLEAASTVSGTPGEIYLVEDGIYDLVRNADNSCRIYKAGGRDEAALVANLSPKYCMAIISGVGQIPTIADALRKLFPCREDAVFVHCGGTIPLYAEERLEGGAPTNLSSGVRNTPLMNPTR